LLLPIGLAGLVYGLVEAPRAGWFEPTAEVTVGPVSWARDSALSIGFVSLLLGLVVLAIFVLVERSRGNAGKPTLVDLSLFKITSSSSGPQTSSRRFSTIAPCGERSSRSRS